MTKKIDKKSAKKVAKKTTNKTSKEKKIKKPVKLVNLVSGKEVDRVTYQISENFNIKVVYYEVIDTERKNKKCGISYRLSSDNSDIFNISVYNPAARSFTGIGDMAEDLIQAQATVQGIVDSAIDMFEKLY